MNVIPISEREGFVQAPGKGMGPLLETARDMTVERLHQALKTMLDKVDDALFEMAEKSENNALQTVYFDSMREVRLKRARIETEFKNRFLSAFEHSRDSQSSLKKPGAESSGLKLSLVDDEAMEEEIAIANMAEKISQDCRDELFGLNRRIGVLLGKPNIETAENPLGPEPVCRAIKEAVGSIEAGIQIRLIILKLFDRYVASEVDTIYQAVNLYLVEQQVLPEIRTSIRRTPGHHRPPASGAGHAPRADAPPAPENLLGMLQQLLGAGGGDAAAPWIGAGASGRTFTAATAPVVLGALTRLQQSGMAVSGSTAGSATMESGQDVPTNVLREIRTQGLVPALDKAGDMTLDIVAMLFDYILDDKNLPDPIRVLIGRLQIPILKVALLDREFFSRKSHPARRLLNGMAEQAVEWSGDPPLHDRLHKIVRHVVQRILDEFEDEVAIFAGLVEEFERMVTDAKHDAAIRAERTARVVQGQSRLEEAKLFAREAIERRLQQPHVNDVIRNFLLTHWKHLIITDYIREGESGGSLQRALAIIDDLIWSVAPKATAEERKKLGALLPGLLAGLKKGMESISMPPIARTGFLNRLAKCHAEAVRQDKPAAATDSSPAATGGTGSADPVPSATASAAALPTGSDRDSIAAPVEAGRAWSNRLEATLPPDVAGPSQPGSAAISSPADPTERTLPDIPAAEIPPAATPLPAPADDELPLLDLDLGSGSEPFDPGQRVQLDLSAPLHPDTSGRMAPAGDGGLADALRERLLYDTEVRLADVLPAGAAGQSARPSTGGRADGSLFDLFRGGADSAEELVRMATLGEIEIEELTLDEPAVEMPADVDDQHTRFVAGLRPGVWLEFKNIDGTVSRGRLTCINAATDSYLFTDRGGQKLPDRTRNGLVAEFRRGSAWLARDTPLLDRAFTRLLDGLSGQARA